jgi:serine/threonine protein kinase
MEDEAFALSQLSHPNIVSFVELVECKTSSYLVMEYCEGGDLRTLLNSYVELA